MRIGINIDGVLTDIKSFINDIGRMYFNKEIVHPSMIKVKDIFDVSGEDERKFWEDNIEEYMQNFYSRTFSSEITKKLHSDGCKIFLLSDRLDNPIFESLSEKNIKDLTKKWLKKNNIYYDKIIYTTGRKFFYSKDFNFNYVIDSEPSRIVNLSRFTKVLIFDSEYNNTMKLENAFHTTTWLEVYSSIYTFYKLEKILLQNKDIKAILNILDTRKYKKFYLCAGAVYQSIFNFLYGRKLTDNIKNYDIRYFDENRSFEKESNLEKELLHKFKKIKKKFVIKNQARVHLWLKEKYDYEINEFSNFYESIDYFYSTVASVAVRLEKGKMFIYAPYGIGDIFNETIKPIKKSLLKDVYKKKCKELKEVWPSLEIEPWR